MFCTDWASLHKWLAYTVFLSCNENGAVLASHKLLTKGNEFFQFLLVVVITDVSLLIEPWELCKLVFTTAWLIMSLIKSFLKCAGGAFALVILMKDAVIWPLKIVLVLILWFLVIILHHLKILSSGVLLALAEAIPVFFIFFNLCNWIIIQSFNIIFSAWSIFVRNNGVLTSFIYWDRYIVFMNTLRFFIRILFIRIPRLKKAKI